MANLKHKKTALLAHNKVDLETNYSNLKENETIVATNTKGLQSNLIEFSQYQTLNTSAVNKSNVNQKSTTVNLKGVIMNEKRKYLEDYLKKGKTMIILDSNKTGVILPKHLMNLIQVKLNLSYKFNTSIFQIDDEKITVELSFMGNRFICTIPFSSIYYISMADTLDGIPFLDDMPEIFLEMAQALDELDTIAPEAAAQPNQIDFLNNIPISSSKEIVSNLVVPKIEKERKRKIKSPLHSEKNNNEIAFSSFIHKK